MLSDFLYSLRRVLNQFMKNDYLPHTHRTYIRTCTVYKSWRGIEFDFSLETAINTYLKNSAQQVDAVAVSQIKNPFKIRIIK